MARENNIADGEAPAAAQAGGQQQQQQQEDPGAAENQPRRRGEDGNNDNINEEILGEVAMEDATNNNNNNNNNNHGAEGAHAAIRVIHLPAAGAADPDAAARALGGPAIGRGVMRLLPLNAFPQPPLPRGAQQQQAANNNALNNPQNVNIMRQVLRSCWNQGGQVLEFGGPPPSLHHNSQQQQHYRLKAALLEVLKRRLARAAAEQQRPLPSHVILRNCKFADGAAAKMADLLEFLQPTAVELLDTTQLPSSSAVDASFTMLRSNPTTIRERLDRLAAAAAAAGAGPPNHNLVRHVVVRPPAVPGAQPGAAPAAGAAGENNNLVLVPPPQAVMDHLAQHHPGVAHLVLEAAQNGNAAFVAARANHNNPVPPVPPPPQLREPPENPGEGPRRRPAPLEDGAAVAALNDPLAMAAMEAELPQPAAPIGPNNDGRWAADRAAGAAAAGPNQPGVQPPRDNENNMEAQLQAVAAEGANDESPVPQQQNNSNNGKTLTHDTVVALFSGLLSVEKLEILRLAGLGLRNEGVVRLLCCLYKNVARSDTLRILNLAACRWNLRSMTQLAQAMIASPATCLVHFALTSSPLVDDAMTKVLLQALARSARNLERLILCDNPLITLAGSLPSVTSFLLLHSCIQELSLTLTVTTDCDQEDAPLGQGKEDATSSSVTHAGTTQPVMDFDHSCAMPLLEFCEAVRHHASLVRLGVETTVRQKSKDDTNSNGESNEENNNNNSAAAKTVLASPVMAPPIMAVALLQMAFEKTNLQELRLIKLLHWERRSSLPLGQRKNKNDAVINTSLRILRLYPCLVENTLLWNGIKQFAPELDLLSFRSCCLSTHEPKQQRPMEEALKDSLRAWTESVDKFGLATNPLRNLELNASPTADSAFGDMIQTLFVSKGLQRLSLNACVAFPLDKIFTTDKTRALSRTSFRALHVENCRLDDDQLRAVLTAGGGGVKKLEIVAEQPSLVTLSLSHNSLRGESLPLLVRFLKCNPHLQHLMLSENPTLFSDRNEHRESFATSVRDHRCLETLNLQGCGFEDGCSVPISLMDSFDKNPVRKSMRLNFATLSRRHASDVDNGDKDKGHSLFLEPFGAVILDQLVDALSSMENLRAVHFHDVHRRHRMPLQPLISQVLVPARCLEELTINFPLNRSAQTITVLSSGLRNHRTLHSLRLGGPSVDDAAMATLVDALISTTMLRTLGFRRIGITAQSIGPFLQLLAHQVKLETLELTQIAMMRGNSLDERILTFVEGIGGHASLKKLFVRSCVLNAGPLTRMLLALESTDKVEMLDIGGNVFLQSREWKWVDSLPRLKRLRLLRLPRQIWCHEQWCQAVELLKKSTSICQLEYDASPIFDHWARGDSSAVAMNTRSIPGAAVSQIMRRNRYLKHVRDLVETTTTWGGGGATTSLVAQILQQFGSNGGEGSAIFAFLRSGSHGIWSCAVLAVDKKRACSYAGRQPPSKRQRTKSPEKKTRRPREMTLETMQREILRYGGAITMKQLLKNFGIEKKSAELQRFKAMVKEICGIRMDATQGENVLYLKGEPT